MMTTPRASDCLLLLLLDIGCSSENLQRASFAHSQTGTGQITAGCYRSIPAVQNRSEMASRTITNTIRLLIPAGGAKPAPPVGPALGQAGLNIMSFCKDFNAKTQDIKADVPIPVVITAYSDKTYEYDMKKPPVTYLIKQAAGLTSCSQRPGFESVGVISLKHIYEIAKLKKGDAANAHLGMEAICKSIIATCKSMGVRVVPRPEDV